MSLGPSGVEILTLMGLRDRLLLRICDSVVDTYDRVESKPKLRSSLSMNESSVVRRDAMFVTLSIELVKIEASGSRTVGWELVVTFDRSCEDWSSDWDCSGESSARTMVDSSIAPRIPDMSDISPAASSREIVFRLLSSDIHRNSGIFRSDSCAHGWKRNCDC